MYDFPNSPTLNQVFGNYTWDGQKWAQTPGLIAATALPLMDGTPAVVGVGNRYAREDHVHPSDTSRVSKAGDTMSGSSTVAGNVTAASLVVQTGTITDSSAILLYREATHRFQNVAGTLDYLVVNPAGISVVGNITVSNGVLYSNVAGGHNISFGWTGSAIQVLVDNSNVGTLTPTSDYRVKDNIAALPSTWNSVKALNPISFNYKDYAAVRGTPDQQWGFVAHELQGTLVPTAASGFKDDPDAIQSPNLNAVVAALTRALQEAMARIEVLEGGA